MNSIRHDSTGKSEAIALLARIAASLERLERRFDDFAGVYLPGKLPYGKPTDRWARRGRGNS